MNDTVTALPDQELLAAYSQRGDEGAFAALFHRHGALPYHVALRTTGRRELAEEAAQNVMAALAAKATRLQAVQNLPGWLHRATVLEAAALLRRERRAERKHAALAAATPMTTTDAQDALPPHAGPQLDAAIDALNEKERHYVLQRFYAGQSVKDIAAAAGETEAAVQRRGHRALEKLANRLTKRGAVVAAPALLAALSGSLRAAAPQAWLDSGAAAALKQAAASAAAPGGWLVWRWPLAQGAAAAVCLAGLVTQEAAASRQSAPSASIPVSARVPVLPRLPGRSPRPSPLAVPTEAFDKANPDLRALAAFCYRRSLGVNDDPTASLLFFRQSEWFGRDKSRALKMLDELWHLDIPTAHSRELAASFLSYDWIEPKAKLDWTLKFHERDDPPGQWHKEFIRSLSSGLHQWSTQDPAGAWAWARPLMDAGRLGGTATNNHAGQGARGVVTSTLFSASLKAGAAQIADEIYAGMTIPEKAESLGILLATPAAEGRDAAWCLEQISALPTGWFQYMAVKRLGQQGGWSARHDKGMEDSAAFGARVAQLANGWQAPLDLRVQFVRSSMLEYQSQHTGARLAAALRQAEPGLAEALIKHTAEAPYSAGSGLAEVMQAALERKLGAALAHPIADAAARNPSDKSAARAFAQVLPLMPVPQVKIDLLRRWAEAAATAKVTRASLQAAGLTEAEAAILFP